MPVLDTYACSLVGVAFLNHDLVLYLYIMAIGRLVSPSSSRVVLPLVCLKAQGSEDSPVVSRVVSGACSDHGWSSLSLEIGNFLFLIAWIP